MNHGFAARSPTLPANAPRRMCHGSAARTAHRAQGQAGVSRVQYQPGSIPGPRDSHYLFERFVEIMRQQKKPPDG